MSRPALLVARQAVDSGGMAISIPRPQRKPRVLPTSPAGWLAVALFVLSLALLAARLVLTPAFGLPLNYLIVFVSLATSGLVAMLAVTLQRDRAVAVLATLVAGLSAAAWLFAESIGGVPPVTLYEGDNGRALTVASGGEITIQLPGNPTTGYNWEATVGDSSVLYEANAPQYTPSSGALGAGGKYTFHYNAAAAGQCDLTLVYRRSWETGVTPLKTYRVKIVVQ
jgi:predicted secreted protein